VAHFAFFEIILHRKNGWTDSHVVASATKLKHLLWGGIPVLRNMLQTKLAGEDFFALSKSVKVAHVFTKSAIQNIRGSHHPEMRTLK
jgi:hypothetical protein